MPSQISQFFAVAPGSSDLSVFLLALVLPSVVTFAVIYGAKLLLRVRWGGYWDAV